MPYPPRLELWQIASRCFPAYDRRVESFYLIAIIVGPGLLLALPRAIQGRGLASYLGGVVMVTVGITCPLLVFFLSGFLVPEWKGESLFGWFGCFHAGKFALTPLVLWACAAFYAMVVLGSQHRTKTWVVLGMFNGAIVTCICAGVGVIFHLGSDLVLWLAVPLYVAVWYTWIAVRLVEESEISPRTYLFNLLASSPLWALAVYWMRHTYQGLPDEAPNCFVVTAASRGTPWLVGTLSEFEHSGGARLANLQLVRFWRLEERWMAQSPGSHRCFRRIYNRIGPLVARRISHPLCADAVYLMLKPIEWSAAIVLRIRRRR